MLTPKLRTDPLHPFYFSGQTRAPTTVFSISWSSPSATVHVGCSSSKSHSRRHQLQIFCHHHLLEPHPVPSIEGTRQSKPMLSPTICHMMVPTKLPEGSHYLCLRRLPALPPEGLYHCRQQPGLLCLRRQPCGHPREVLFHCHWPHDRLPRSSCHCHWDHRQPPFSPRRHGWDCL